MGKKIINKQQEDSNQKLVNKKMAKKEGEESKPSNFVKEGAQESKETVRKEKKIKNLNKNAEKSETLPKEENLNQQDDKKILNDAEEEATLEIIKERYSKYLEETKEKLIPQLHKNLMKKAITNLKNLVMNRYKDNLNLLQNETEEFLYINFVLGKLPFKFSLRPVNVPLKNSIYDSEKFNTRVCIFVKDPRSAFKELPINSQFPFKVKVIDVKKLKEKYSRFQERRNLLKDNDIFICDQKIYMLLKKLLGKPFYVHKKYPVALKLNYSEPEEIKNLILSHVEKSTKFYMTHGPNYTVKFARVVQDNKEILENLMEALLNTLPHVLKWGVELEE
jgi:hypothetical protein